MVLKTGTLCASPWNLKAKCLGQITRYVCFFSKINKTILPGLQCFDSLGKFPESCSDIIHRSLLGMSFSCHGVRSYCTLNRSVTPVFRDPYYVKSDSKLITCKYYRQQKVYRDVTGPIFLQAEKHLNQTAVLDEEGAFSYGDILHHSMELADSILCLQGVQVKMKLEDDRIGLLTDRDATYVIGQYATWICNGISVPLCETHPPSEWEYYLEDSQCSLVLVADRYVDKITPIAEKLGIKVIQLIREHFVNNYKKNRWFQSDFASNPKKVMRQYEKRKLRWFDLAQSNVMKKAALIVYTSGTTGRPKLGLLTGSEQLGVVLTHGNLSSMVSGMIRSWEWSSADVILHVLPLHHVHGIVNVLLTPLACGATCVLEPGFNAKKVWSLLTAPTIHALGKSINLFMAVPTIYARLISYFDEHIATAGSKITADFIKVACSRKIRLMVSGSAALPEPISIRWTEITGHILLERYGMTEIGMALTNPLHGPRIAGTVGNPFPNVSVCISKSNVYNPKGYDVLAEGNDRQTVVTKGAEEELGDLFVKGPTVFQEYWNKPEATAQSFTKDGWFKTGDTALFANGVYKIIGRTSVDVIKSGGYKISALEVERHLLAHPDIVECAVLGLPDMTWGQKVAAVIVCAWNKTLELNDLRKWAEQHLPAYQMPTVLKCVESIPHNAMGKVNKRELLSAFFPEAANRKW